MTETTLQAILEKIGQKNPEHAAKLNLNLAGLGSDYRDQANDFFAKYGAYLQREGKTPDFAVDCYLHMIDDMLEERMDFIRSGSYSNTSFNDVERRIYGNPEIMTYHMHGLVLAQFLWFDQYERIRFFISNLERFVAAGDRYLEIGGGHGLYAYEALKRVPQLGLFDLVDISESSLQLARGIINDDRIHYYLRNIFDFADDEKYDFVTMGEVLEHVEDPLSLLSKVGELLADEGVCYLTTPVNAPMIDHIYLFNNEDEIRELFGKAGFEVIEEISVISEKMDARKAARLKVPVMYAAFIKKKQ